LSTFLIVAALVVVVAVVGWRVLAGGGRHGRPAGSLDTLAAWPPRATRVLSHAERQTYDLLCHALPGHMILAQVPLQRFIKVPTRNSYAEWLRRVGQLSADFVVCDANSQVMAVVEIEGEDDQPGSRAQRRRERMLKVLKSADVPVHVWRASALPSAGAVREAILPAAEVPQLSDEIGGVPAQAGAPARAATLEPRPSTWFDDFDSAPAPLTGTTAPDKDTKPGS